ncbi:potassium uptake protein [Planoprotostelium fungivorum]|uniref:Potassium uptake protein n=1 Tax=Planoprotostelium fungivorum TaxID=1890364 RepID=A0A2P6NPY7_9EUKA|nr:potassium uptake protein [Planoprotostelium fungivorum]
MLHGLKSRLPSFRKPNWSFNSPFQKPSAHFAWLTIQSLGVIFPEIGTSPLITNLFNAPEYISDPFGFDTLDINQYQDPQNSDDTTWEPPEQWEVLGVYGLVVWSLILVASLKYAIIILTADNDEEGGIFSMCSLLLSNKHSKLGPKGKTAITLIACTGASIIIGTGALTPAVRISASISQINDYITYYSNTEKDYIMPVAAGLTVVCFLLVVVFFINRFGVSRLGKIFGPVMLLWFLMLIMLGIWRISEYPAIWACLNPAVPIMFLVRKHQEEDTRAALETLGRVFLTVAGCEIIYADMGHFHRGPLRVAWFGVVFPSLMLNYLGQGANLMRPDRQIYADNPFYKPLQMFPKIEGLGWFLFSFSALCTIIAAQAGGIFSTVSQAVSLNLFPPLRVHRTNKKLHGQVYMPDLNWFLCLVAIAIVLGFHSPSAITEIYGLAVAALMTTTTILFVLVALWRWNTPWWKIAPMGIFFIIDLLFLAGTCVELRPRGWPGIAIGVFFSFVMFSWYIGELQLQRETERARLIWFKGMDKGKSRLVFQKGMSDYHCTASSKSMRRLKLSTSTASVDETTPSSPTESENEDILQVLESEDIDLNHIMRTNHTGIFISTRDDNVPLSFTSMITRSYTAPGCLIFVRLLTMKKPYVEENDPRRVTLVCHCDSIYTVVIRYGFMQGKRNMAEIAEIFRGRNIILPGKTFYYLHREELHVTGFNWRTPALKFYSNMKRNYRDTSMLRLTHADTLELCVYRHFDMSKYQRGPRPADEDYFAPKDHTEMVEVEVQTMMKMRALREVFDVPKSSRQTRTIYSANRSMRYSQSALVLKVVSINNAYEPVRVLEV